MKIEELKKKFILEAHNHFVTVDKTRPYVKFGNFVESLRRNDNIVLIESIQKGVLTIIEGAFQNEQDPNYKLINHVKNVSCEQLNQYIEDNNTSEIIGLLYPVIIAAIDRKDLHERDATDIFSKVINNLDAAAKKLKPASKDSNTLQYLTNYVNKFILSGEMRNRNRPSKEGKIKLVNAFPEDNNPAQSWMYTDDAKKRLQAEGKSIIGKEYGHVLNQKHSKVNGEDTLIVQIKWAGKKNSQVDQKSSGEVWAVKPVTEWVPIDDLNTFNLSNQDTHADAYDFDSTSGTNGESSTAGLTDTAVSEKDFEGKDTLSELLIDIENIIRDGGPFPVVNENGKPILKKMVDKEGNPVLDRNGNQVTRPKKVELTKNEKTALLLYFRGQASDKGTRDNAASSKQNLERALADGKQPQLPKHGGPNPKYDTPEKIKKGIRDYNQIIKKNTTNKKSRITKYFKIPPATFNNYIKLIYAKARGDENIIDKLDKVFDETPSMGKV